MQVFTEQVCGPVLRVTPFDTDEETVSLANALADPTAAYAGAGRAAGAGGGRLQRG
jgi:acyl-CoA reductase-like NAD-dependent aldehyde dehydrogenase